MPVRIRLPWVRAWVGRRLRWVGWLVDQGVIWVGGVLATKAQIRVVVAAV
jgi:hypothetical protein